jgi:hypothetical protein
VSSSNSILPSGDEDSLTAPNPQGNLSVYQIAALSRTTPHGTEGAYKRHRRHDETPCELCRKAWREGEARRRAARKARRGNIGEMRLYVGRLRDELAQAERALAEAEGQPAAGSATGSAAGE